MHIFWNEWTLNALCDCYNRMENQKRNTRNVCRSPTLLTIMSSCVIFITWGNSSPPLSRAVVGCIDYGLCCNS